MERVPSPPPLTSLPLMALQIQRGGLALLALACIQPLETSQIIRYLLKFANLGLFLLVWDRRTSWASLYLDLLINHFFLLKLKSLLETVFPAHFILSSSHATYLTSSSSAWAWKPFLKMSDSRITATRFHIAYLLGCLCWCGKTVIEVSPAQSPLPHIAWRREMSSSYSWTLHFKEPRVSFQKSCGNFLFS